MQLQYRSLCRVTLSVLCPLLLAILVPGPAVAESAREAPGAAPLTAEAALERLKTLEGEWTGTMSGGDAPVQIVYRVTAGGSTVMETLFPGTDHEMVSLFHLDGKDLVMTHYCAVGNQPRFRLKRKGAAPNELVFDFAGGTNLNPRKDGHIHNGKIVLVDPDHIESEWTFYQDGQALEANRFSLTRKGS